MTTGGGVHTERRGELAILRLDKPRGNAIDEPLVDGLLEEGVNGRLALNGQVEVGVGPGGVGAQVHQVFDVLVYLITNRDRVVPKTELLDGVWGDRFVSESALTSRIRSARQAVGDDGDAQRRIRTAHGRGYQFIGDVSNGHQH